LAMEIVVNDVHHFDPEEFDEDPWELRKEDYRERRTGSMPTKKKPIPAKAVAKKKVATKPPVKVTPEETEEKVVTTRTVGKIDPQAAHQALRGSSRAGGDRAEFFSTKENGVYDITLFPPIAPLVMPWVPRWGHGIRLGKRAEFFEVSGERQDGSVWSFKTPLTCIHEHGGAVCPVCVVQDWLTANSKSGLDVKPACRMLLNIYHNAGFYVWESPASVTQQMGEVAEGIEGRPALGWDIFSTLSNWRITRRNEKRGKRGNFVVYDVEYAEDQGQEDTPQDWLGRLYNLPEVIRTWPLDVMIPALSRGVGGHVPLREVFKPYPEFVEHLP